MAQNLHVKCIGGKIWMDSEYNVNSNFHADVFRSMWIHLVRPTQMKLFSWKIYGQCSLVHVTTLELHMQHNLYDGFWTVFQRQLNGLSYFIDYFAKKSHAYFQIPWNYKRGKFVSMDVQSISDNGKVTPVYCTQLISLICIALYKSSHISPNMQKDLPLKM